MLKKCKYVLTHLEDFDFHDAAWELKASADGRWVFAVEELNLHKGSPANPHTYDIEIPTATMVWEGVTVHSVEENVQAYTMNHKGHPESHGTTTMYQDRMAEKKLIKALIQGVSIHHVEISEHDGRTVLFFETNCDASIDVVCSFDSATVGWSEYGDKAWYEKSADRTSL